MRRTKRKKFTKAEILNRAISQWEHRQDAATMMLQKSSAMLLKLRKQRQRMLLRLTTAESKAADDLVDSTIRTPAPIAPQVESFVARGIAAQSAVDDAIPEFLERTGRAKDEAARAEIEAEQADKKKRSAERRIAKIKIGQEIKRAELTGQRRKMPLTGKAALAAIHGK